MLVNPQDQESGVVSAEVGVGIVAAGAPYLLCLCIKERIPLTFNDRTEMLAMCKCPVAYDGPR